MSAEDRPDLPRGPVIVAFDGRSGGRDALALGAVLAEALGRELIAAFAFASEASPSAVPREQLREQAEQLLTAALADAHRPANPRTVAASSPARGIHELAEAEHAGALVVGSSHRGPAGRVLAGSAAQRLLSGSSCPVAVAPAGLAQAEDFTLRTIGVAFDGRADAWSALQQAAKLAAGAGASLRIVCAVEPVTSPPLAPLETEHILLERQRRAEVAVRQAAASVSSELHAETELVPGVAAEALEREAARGLDLLVLGSRGFGPLRRVFLGSVSSELMRRAPCPVMVVPRSAEFDLSPAGLAAQDELRPAAQGST